MEEDDSGVVDDSGPNDDSWQYAIVDGSDAAKAAISKLQKLFRQSYKRVPRAPLFT